MPTRLSLAQPNVKRRSEIIPCRWKASRSCPGVATNVARLLLTLFWLVLPTTACWGGVIQYTYVGRNYNFFPFIQDKFSASHNAALSLSFANGLAPSTAYGDGDRVPLPDILYWSASDGVSQYGSLSQYADVDIRAALSTDSDGAIATWAIQVGLFKNEGGLVSLRMAGPESSTSTWGGPPFVCDLVEIHSPEGLHGAAATLPGAWTVVAVPEPSALVMGAGGIAWGAWRRRKRHRLAA
jgi:hypothetical protein